MWHVIFTQISLSDISESISLKDEVNGRQKCNKRISRIQDCQYTSHEEGKDDLIKAISSSVNLKLAINLMHSSRPAKIVYSPPKGFFRKYKSNLKENK